MLTWSLGPDLEVMFPVTFDAPSEPVSIEEWVRQNRVAINKDLKETGVVLIRGLAMRDPGDFNRFVAAFGLPVFSYQESLSNAVRINYSERVFTANEAPPEVEIYLHHEMAQNAGFAVGSFFLLHLSRGAGWGGPLYAGPTSSSKLLGTLPPCFSKS